MAHPTDSKHSPERKRPADARNPRAKGEKAGRRQGGGEAVEARAGKRGDAIANAEHPDRSRHGEPPT